MKFASLALIMIFLLTVASAAIANDTDRDPSETEVNWQVISSGGDNNGASASYSLAGTVGQTSTGSGSSTSYGLSHGFWQALTGLDYVCGDADGSSAVDIDDVVYLIAFIFSGGSEPMPYESGDADCSGAVDIDDVVYLIAFIFSAGPEPCDPDGDGVPDC
jgi:hypothetical protein